MTYDPKGHHRRSIRLQGYDYSRPGMYFVTVCAQNRACLFGDVVDGEMCLNEAGCRVHAAWGDLPCHYSGVELDAFVVMPNHVHGIIMIVGEGLEPVAETDHAWLAGAGLKPAPTMPLSSRSAGAGFKPAPTVPLLSGSVGAGFKPAPAATHLPELVRAFKTFSARKINGWRNVQGAAVWQRNYYEHIIRNDDALCRVREYIMNNPAQWALDRENPAWADGIPPLFTRCQRAEPWRV